MKLYTSSNGEENKNLSVILTPDEFFNEANKLKNIQESYSYKVTIVKLSSVLSYKEAEIPDLKPIIGYKDASEEEKAILKNYNYSLSRKILTYLKELLKDGKIVLEKYYDNFTMDSLWYWASAGKTVTSFMTGIAQQEGHLNISDTTSQYLSLIHI